MPLASASTSSDLGGFNLSDDENRVQQAVSAVLASGTDSATFCLSIAEAARQFGVSRYTVRRRLQGTRDRRTAHQDQQRLTPSQEDTLSDWAKACARYSLPLTQVTFLEKAELVAGFSLGETWFRKYLERNPNVKLLWTTPLESCRAQALNHSTVHGYFDLLSEIITKYNISPSNTYNMDEKGLQLGIGRRSRVLVDRNQSSVRKKEDGNKELVTIIECICADGTALQPLFIMKGMRTSPSWASDNPIHASVASSPNGWTDTELGALWLERIFEPQSSLRVVEEDDIRLLILDGHNSHCSLSFLGVAERTRIFVLCLPPHTTHALQPCDVGVFGPLSTHYKTEVSAMARWHVPITKQNVVSVYSRARQKAFTTTSIQAAFRKCGIYPLNRNAIPDSAFDPALATTTQPAQPISAAAPKFINAVITLTDVTSNDKVTAVEELTDASDGKGDTAEPLDSTRDHVLNEITETEQLRKFTLHLPDIPASLPPAATKAELYERITVLERLLCQASDQIAADYAQKVLMDDENGQLRMQLFQKKKDKDGTRALTVSARLLTHEDSDLWNQIHQHSERYKDMHLEIKTKADEFRKRREEKEKKEKEATKQAEKTAKAMQKEAEAAARAAKKEAEAAEKAERRRAETAARAARKETEAAEKMAKKKAEAAAKAARKEAEAAEKVAKKVERNASREARKQASLLDGNKENAHIPNNNVPVPVPSVRRQPRPRPAFRVILDDACTSAQNMLAPPIDPQLLVVSGEKRDQSILDEGLQEDGHITKRHRTSIGSDHD